jgi:hypothetical protein
MVFLSIAGFYSENCRLQNPIARDKQEAVSTSPSIVCYSIFKPKSKPGWLVARLMHVEVVVEGVVPDVIFEVVVRVVGDAVAVCGVTACRRPWGRGTSSCECSRCRRCRTWRLLPSPPRFPATCLRFPAAHFLCNFQHF